MKPDIHAEQDADDVRVLIAHLKLDSFTYVDIAAIREWERALEQWPLLSEWNNWSKNDQQ
ncbi:MAG TPA: BcsR/BcsP family cellulose biosynthesis protein [Burkholderiaceae bacterium]|nr:BcsR/BcsP family cellulose biosynthesis protein [Burkholderiaceae bacterium]